MSTISVKDGARCDDLTAADTLAEATRLCREVGGPK